MHKLALVVGHNTERQGAHSAHLAISEWPYWSKWAQDFAVANDPAISGFEVKVFYRPSEVGYGAQIKQVYSEVDAWGADASIELHFNSAKSKTAHGCEMLSSGSKLSMALAAEVQKNTVFYCYEGDERDGVNRGVRTPMEKDRGYMSLHTGRAPAIIAEPFFGSNAQDCKMFDGEEFAAALTEAVAFTFANHYPRKDLTESRTMKAAAKQRKMTMLGVGTSIAGAASSLVEALGSPETAIEAAEAASALSRFMPFLGPTLIVAAIIAFVVNQSQTEKIEDAREEDHERGLR